MLRNVSVVLMKYGVSLTFLVLEKSPYLAGDCLSAADITFAALVRFHIHPALASMLMIEFSHSSS